MNAQEIVHAWGKILRGERPSLSIEITRNARCDARAAMPMKMAIPART